MEWDEQRPGFVEIDLVGHEGGNPRGDFIQTLNVTDVCTGWTEMQAVKNKAQTWVFEALKDIQKRLPFDLLGIDSDNGSEFINDHLVRFCREEEITFTRSRSYRKNDNCFVEQKNYTIVRRYVGYSRYDTDTKDTDRQQGAEEIRCAADPLSKSVGITTRNGKQKRDPQTTVCSLKPGNAEAADSKTAK